MEYVKMWEITGDNIREIKKQPLNLEKRIEDWIEKDISVISDDLLIIGRQVDTGFRGTIDLLCLKRNGDIAILELKRDKTPREVTAQVLDYASWAKDLSNDQISEIAKSYFEDAGSLEDAYRKRFAISLPETLNENHSMLIIASEMDDATERIIKYLSDSYGVGINTVKFQYFPHEDGREFLVRTFLMEPNQVEQNQGKLPSKRKPPLSWAECQEKAEQNGVGELYRKLLEGLTARFDQKITTRSTVGFVGIVEGSRNTIFNLLLGDSNLDQGVCFQAYLDRLAKYFSSDKDTLFALFPGSARKEIRWAGTQETVEGFFENSEEIDRMLAGLSKAKSSPQ